MDGINVATLNDDSSIQQFGAGTAAQAYASRHQLPSGGRLFPINGFMAYQIALREPARFAGLMALSSWLPPELAQQIEKSDAHAELPTLVIHGTDDPMVHVDRARESRDALLSLGVPTVYREYGMGHEIQPDALRELAGWLEEKVLSPVVV